MIDATPKIELAGVVVRRGAFTLDVPSLTLRAGEVLAVIGPNGSGKSTLLHTVALLEKPAAGEVRFEGRRAHADALRMRRRMAVVFQEPLLLDRSVRGNVALGMRLRGRPRRERRAQEDRWLAAFGVAPLAERPARALSGGEAQRVNLARAFALEPEVLLLDEPFAALDAPTRESLSTELSAVLRETGITTLFVTHDRGEALRFGDRVAVLIDGRLRQAGPSHEVFSAPADPETAAFVGVETILPGRVLRQDDGVAMVRVGGGDGREVAAAVDSDPPGDVLVCVRPEDVTLAPPADGWPSSARNQFVAEVRRVSPAGMQVRVELDCGFPLFALVTHRSSVELDIREGARVIASFKASAVHLIPRGVARP